MAASDALAAAVAGEELAAAACVATARWVPGAEAELHALAAAHLATATALGGATARPRRWRALRAGLQVMLAALVGTELGALVWLRGQEQQLLDAYVALEASPTLTEAERQRLRWELVPTAFARFGRVDRLVMLREEQGVFA